MCICSRIDYNSNKFSSSCVNRINYLSFSIGLKEINITSKFHSQIIDGCVDFFKRECSVNVRFTLPELIQVGSMQNKETHRLKELLCQIIRFKTHKIPSF